MPGSRRGPAARGETSWIPSNRAILAAVRAALGGQVVRSLGLVLSDDAYIAALHERFMADPSPTDVLTFDLRDDARDPTIEGEIVVSVETACRQARRLKLPPQEETLRYFIHGVLHLLGYDDHSPAERRRMRRAENDVLQTLASPAGRASSGRTARGKSPPPVGRRNATHGRNRSRRRRADHHA